MKARNIAALEPELRDLIPTTIPHQDKQGRLWYRFRGDNRSLYQQINSGNGKDEWLQASDQRHFISSLPSSFQHRIHSSQQSLITTQHCQQLTIPAVQPQPLHSALFLCRQLPSLFTRDGLTVYYPHCDECGGILVDPLYHCPQCHLDYSPSLNHACSSSLPACSSQIRQAKADLQLLELALPLLQMTKKARVFWSPPRRAIWVRKVRRSLNSTELMTCLLMLECCVAKGGLTRWYKWAVPSVHAQVAVTSSASFFIRLHSLDEAIKYIFTQDAVGEIEEDDEKNAISKAKMVSSGIVVSKPTTPKSTSSSVASSKTTKSASSRSEKKEKNVDSMQIVFF